MLHPKPPKRPKKRPSRVSPEDHSVVLLRDGECVAAKLDSEHHCRDEWGQEHGPRDFAKLTVEHVKKWPAMAIRADSVLRWMVAMCHYGNTVEVWGSKHRGELREYLLRLYGR